MTLIDTKYFQSKPEEVKVSVQTDIGNDPDDALSLYMLLDAVNENKIPRGSVKQIVTTLYQPLQKAGIAAKICKFMKNCEIPIFSGYGSENVKNEEEFLKVYPFWPKLWGIPGFTNTVSLGQGKGYEELSYEKDQIIPEKDTPKVIQEVIEKYGPQEIILGLAPCTDLAKVINKCDTINRIILMGGYFGKESEDTIEISRPGYNTAIDPDAAEIILTQRKHPILIFNSQHITDWKFSWMQDEILAILASEEKNTLGKAIAKDLAHYWSNKKPNPFGSLVMADVLTTYVGLLEPELIKSTMPVEFSFNSKTFFNKETEKLEPIHMMHTQAKTLFTVKKTESSNVHIVTELTVKPEILRSKVVENIVVPLFFKDVDSFRKAVEEQQKQSLSHEDIKKILDDQYPDMISKL